jgi:hypothetical protein
MVHVADGVFPETLRDTYWYAPAAKRYVKRELRWRNFRTRLVIDDEEELVAYEVHAPLAAASGAANSPTPGSGTYRSP